MELGEAFLNAVRAGFGLIGAVYALAGVGLNLHFGYTGLLNFGHAGFLLVGAYGMGITVDMGGNFWVGILVGLAGCVVLALILGIPTLRLRADYLAITTIAASEILRIGTRSQLAQGLTGGVFGLDRVADAFYRANPFTEATIGFGPFTYSRNDAWLLLFGWGLVVACSLLIWLLIRSPWGRVIRAIREDEDAARSLGKNVFSYKMQSLIIGGVIGGLAGQLFIIGIQNLRPDFFDPLLTFFVYAAVILGGPATVWGPAIGSILFWFIISFSAGLMEGLVKAGIVSGQVLTGQDIGATRFVLVGVGLMFLMIYRPQGIFGRREEMLLDAR